MGNRLVNFAKDAVGAVSNINKATAYAVNPTHYDDIAKGALKTGEFVAEHPSVVKDVAVAVAKDQLKPQNLAINAALIGATVATGGAAAPAWAARVGLTARGVKTGVEVGRGVEAAEGAIQAGRAARSTQKAIEVGRAAEEVIEGGRTGSKLARGMEEINDVRRTMSPIAQRTHAFRTGIGEKILAGAGEGVEASPLRQVAANLAQGTGGIGRTTRMAGQSDNAYRMQQRVRHVKMARSGYAGAQAAPGAAQAVADPEGYALKKAMGGTKLGNTGEYHVGPSGETIVPSLDDGLDVTDNGIVQPGGDWKERAVLRGGAKLQNFGAGVAASNSLGGGNAFWKGPGREVFGGVGTDYDWRKIEQRPVNQVARSSAFLQGHGFESLAQPGSPPTAAAPVTAAKPVTPPTLPPQKMAASAMYSQGPQTATMPGVRVIPKAGGNQRGGSDHSGFYGSGHVYGENVTTSMTAPGPAWNENMEGSMTFEPLEQPVAKASPRKGGIGPMGLARVHSQIGTNPIAAAPEPLPMVPLLKPQRQKAGV